MTIWTPPAGTVIKAVCSKHPDRVLREGIVGPNGECSHGHCPECRAAFLAETGEAA